MPAWLLQGVPENCYFLFTYIRGGDPTATQKSNGVIFDFGLCFNLELDINISLFWSKIDGSFISEVYLVLYAI